jgi:fumarate reductase subunit D
MARRSIEPGLWLLFSAGGVAAALVLPVVILLFGLVFPLGWLTPPSGDHIFALTRGSIVRVALFLVCTLSLFHWAHRFRFTLYDGLQIKHLTEIIGVVCYGGAIAGSVATVLLLWQAP